MRLPALTVPLLVSLFSLSLGCARESAPPVVGSSDATSALDAGAPSAREPAKAVPRAAPATKAIYRLDFTLTAPDGVEPGSTTIALNLEEDTDGVVHAARNVALAPNATGGTVRQDVGLRVKGRFHLVARSAPGSGADSAPLEDELLVDVSTEVSAVEPNATSIRKLTANGAGLVKPGKATTLVSMGEGKARYELTVTPTKLR